MATWQTVNLLFLVRIQVREHIYYTVNMTVKKCSKCEIEKPVKEFNSKGLGKFQPYCRPCDNAHAREYYKKNKDRIKKQINRSRAIRVSELSDEIKNLKQSTPCADCGINYPYYVMDFDHITGNKIGNISHMIKSGVTKKVKKEIEKCEIVCANCHRERTYGNK